MSNTTLSLSKLLTNNWCSSLTGSVYFYGHLLPGLALLVFGLTFNPIALYYFSTSRNFRRSAYSFYFSAIAVVDLIRLTVWFLFYLLDYKILKLKLHPLECPSQLYIESVASCISAWLTVCLTLERCLVIYKPLQTVTDTRGKRALIVILSVILASCLVNALLLQPGFYTKRFVHLRCWWRRQVPLAETFRSNAFEAFVPMLKRRKLIFKPTFSDMIESNRHRMIQEQQNMKKDFLVVNVLFLLAWSIVDEKFTDQSTVACCHGRLEDRMSSIISSRLGDDSSIVAFRPLPFMSGHSKHLPPFFIVLSDRIGIKIAKPLRSSPPCED